MMLKIKADRRKEGKGWVPAEVYGPEMENESVSVRSLDFGKVLREAGESSIVGLTVEGGAEYKVLVKDYQLDPVTDEFVHIDFYQPILTEAVEASVPVVLENEAPAVKEEGGVLVRNIAEVDVSALPEDLPGEIRVDVSCLKRLDDQVTVGDLDVGGKVEILRDESDVVVSISTPKTAEELEEELSAPEEEELFVGEEVVVEEEEEPEEEVAEEAEEPEGIEL